MTTLKRLAILGLAALIGACSTEISKVLPDRKVEYKKQRTAEDDLEVPPDLTKAGVGDAMPVPGSGSSATYSQFASQRHGAQPLSHGSASAVLPEVPHIRVMRDGDERWLEIQAMPDEVWSKVIDFWRENGVLLVQQDPAVGVMKTDWLENRADIKEGFITDFLRKALDTLYSAATRDQFRVRLERGSKPGITDLFLTHRGMQEEMRSSVVGGAETGYWVPRPSDPGLEGEMLRRIMIYMGVSEQAAAADLARAQGRHGSRAELVKVAEGVPTLLVNADQEAAWRLVGVALERVGFAVEDRDRSAGLYYVRYDDPTKGDKRGFFDKLAFWRSDKGPSDSRYRVHLQEAGDKTRVTVLDSKGRSAVSGTATRILTLIQEQIR
jgi:outer membrane protein assembly factor BamC